MSRSRYAPHRIRARYLAALSATPVPVHLADPPDADRLTVLGAETVAGREINFGTIAAAPRMWLAFARTEPALLGYVTGLVVGEPELWLCETAHREWAIEAARPRELKQAASRVWFACQRDCEG